MQQLLLWLCSLMLLSGCANALYQGQFSGLDSAGQPNNYLVYWHKTTQVFGSTKAGPILLIPACSLTRLDFNERADGIVLLGEAGRDQFWPQAKPVENGQICGKVLDHQTIAEIEAGILRLQILCRPVVDEMSSAARVYPAASDTPYAIAVIEKTKEWSLFGSTLAAPVPECPARTAN